MNRFAMVIFALAAMACLSTPSLAADIHWTGSGGNSDFFNAANWEPGFPGTPDLNTTLILGSYGVGSPYAVNVASAPTSAIGKLNVGDGADVTLGNVGQTLTINSAITVGLNGGTGTMNLSGTAVLTHNTDGDFQVGNGTTGALNVSGGATVNNNNGMLYIGYGVGGNGTLDLSGGATFNQAGTASIGEVGQGTMTLTGNSTNFTVAGGEFWVGNLGGAGTLTVGTGSDTPSLTVNNNWFCLGRNNSATGSTGTIELKSGTITKNGNGNFLIGDGGAGTMTVTGSSLLDIRSGETWIGQGSTSVSSLTIGTGTDSPTVNANNWFCIGRGGGNGTLTFNSGTLTKDSGGNFIVGDGATGQMTITGNSLLDIKSGELWVGQSGGSSGTLTVGNGTDNPTINVHNWIAVGRGGNAVVNFNSGTLTKTGNGNMTFASGGTYSGTWNHNGGTLDVASNIWVGENNNGIFNLNGGYVKANLVERIGTAGTSEFHFNGGTLEMTGAGNMNVASNYVEIGGANVVLQKDVTFSTGLQAGLASSGGLTKSGPGNMIIANTSTYTGLTQVIGGGLVISNYAVLSSDVAVDSTAKLLAGNGVIGDSFAQGGAVSIGKGVTLSPGNVGAAGTLYITKSLSLDDSKLNINIDSGAGSMVAVFDMYQGIYGTLSATGTTVVTPTQLGIAPSAGTYQLIQFDTMTAGGIGNFALALDSVGAYDAALRIYDNGMYRSLDLVLSASTNEWKGPSTGGNYSTTGGTNWTDGTIPNASGAKAFFGSTYGSGGPVNLNINATVGKIVFDNAYASYSIATSNGSKFKLVPSVLNAAINDVNGSHEIGVNVETTKPIVVTVSNDIDTLTISGAISESGGSYGLTKSGNGTLALMGANSYTGATIFSHGTLTVNTLAAAGSASSLGAATADAANFQIGNATLNYIGGTAATNRGMTVTGPLTMNVQNATPATVSLGGNIVNSVSSLTLTGNGNVAFTNSGVNSLAAYTDTTTRLGGMAIANNAVTFNGGATSVYNVGGVYNPTDTGDFQFALGVGYNGSTSALTIASGTVNVADSQFTVAAGVGTSGPSVGTFTMTGGTLNVLNGEIAFGNNGGKATIVQSGGTINAYSWVGVGRHWPDTLDVGTDTTYTMTGGLLHKYNGGSNLEIGERGHVDASGNIDVYGHGTLDMSGNAQVIVDAGDLKIGVALGAIGKITMKDNASIIHGNDHFCIGVDGGVGELDLSSGTISAGEIWVGQYFSNITMLDTTVVRVPGKGTFKMDGGTVNLRGWFPVGRDRGEGTFTMNGGVFNKTVAAGSTWGNVIVGSVGGNGVFNMNNGVFNNNSQLVLGESNGADLSSGIFNLNGGTMQASAVRQYQSTATGVLNFNGGVLQVSDNTGNNDYNGAGPVFMHSHYLNVTTAAVQAGGAKIDTNGYTIGIDKALTSGATADGGLTKQGAGEMYISATPSYNGVTTISGGSVVLDRSSLPGAVSVSAGATLRLSNPSGLTGTYYNTGVSDIGVYNTLSGLNAHLATLTPDATTHNSKEAGAFFDMGDGGQYFPAGYNSGNQNFQVVWTGTFHAPTAGTYNFATASDDGSMLFLDGNAVVNNNNWQGTTRKTGSVALTAGDHPITIAFYQGIGGYGVWAEVQLPGQQWQYLANDMLTSADALTAQSFSVGTLGGAGNVDLGGALNTLTVNQTADKTLSGVISGSGSLVKDGSAKLTLTQDIAYTGDTVVNAGTLTAQNMTTSPHISVLGTATLNAKSIVADTLTIGGTPLASSAAAVPEPGTLALLALAGLALAGFCLRRR